MAVRDALVRTARCARAGRRGAAGYDLRILVASDRIVGAIFRVAADGEWRTNVALGAVRRSVTDIPRQASELALIAAHVVGAALVGVDLVPDAEGGWTVIELNGAVEFTSEYQLAGDVFADVAGALVARAARTTSSEAASTAA